MKMKKTRLNITAILMAFVAILSSCVTQDPYPASEYVSAMGYGITQDKADANAMENLAALFGTAVETNTTLGTNVLSSSRKGENYETYFSSSTSISSKVENLFGVQIVERKKEKDGYSSLVVVEREPSMYACKESLSDIKKEIESLKSRALQEMGTLRAVETAVSLLSRTEDYNAITMTYNYLSGERRPLTTLVEGKEILKNAMNAFSISLVTEGDENEMVGAAVSSTLTSMGFSVVKDGNARATARVSISWRESKGTGVAEGFVFEEYNATFSLLDENGNTIFSTSDSGKEGHVTFEGAKKRSVEKLSETLSATIEKELKGKYYL